MIIQKSRRVQFDDEKNALPGIDQYRIWKQIDGNEIDLN